MKTKLTSIIFTSFALAAFSHAATIGVNNASALSGGWNDGDNTNVLGTPFGNWSLSAVDNGGFAGFFAGSSIDVGGGNIDSGGQSFGIYGNAGGVANASMPLNSSLATGQTLSFDLAVNFRNGNKGVDVFAGGLKAFNLNIGSDDYIVSDAATGNGSLGDDYSADTVFTLSFNQISAAEGLWEITRSGGVTSTTSGTYTGAISSLGLYVVDTEGGDPNNLYANNFTVVPEPSSALLGGIGVLVLLRRSRRR